MMTSLKHIQIGFMAGKIFLIAWGKITSLNLLKKFRPSELPASHWGYLIELIPALKISA